MLRVFLLVSLALAADPPVLVLPADEDPSAWTAAARLGGFTLGPSGEATVAVAHSASGWTLIARNSAGDEKQVSIAAPLTAQTREDAVWLASSLLSSLPHAPSLPSPVTPVSADTPPTSPTPPVHAIEQAPALPPPARLPVTPAPPKAASRQPASAPPVTTRPTPSAIADPSPAVSAADAVVAGAPSTEPAPSSPAVVATPLQCPEPPPPPACPSVLAETVPAPSPASTTSVPNAHLRIHPHFWAMVGPTVSWRPDNSIGGGADLAAGLRAGQAGWLGLGARWIAPRTFPDIPGSVVETTVDITLGAWWSPGSSSSPIVAPLLGVAGGVSSRAYAQGTREIARFLVPIGDLDVGGRLRLGPALDLVLVGQVRADGGATVATLGDQDPVPLSPWEIGGRLTLRGTIP